MYVTDGQKDGRVQSLGETPLASQAIIDSLV